MDTPVQSKILIVDDTETDIDLLMEILSSGYRIQVANDGYRALKTVKESPPDIILLDIMMPGMDGYEVCQALKADQSTRDIPVIFLTALAEEQNEAKGLSIGAVDYISKPLSADIVKARINTHLNLKHQKEILKENLKLKEEIDVIGRHDIKGPLQAIINIPLLLKTQADLSPNHIEMLDMIKNAGFRILELINNTLEMSKIEKGIYKFRPARVDLLKLIRQIQGESINVISSNDSRIDIYINGRAAKGNDTFYIMGEETLCYSMLANLIKNALEASPVSEGPTINLSEAEAYQIQIHNKGAVPEKIRDRFFDKYVTDGKKRGTGLGTYSAKKLCETMGGGIRFESSEEKGTTIFINFPNTSLKENSIELTSSLKDVATPFDRRLRILVVDDFKPMRSVITGVLKQMGLSDCLEADDGRTAVKILYSNSIDLIISDWYMPFMTGVELLEFVRSKKKFKQIPFIMLTGEADKQKRIEPSKEGISAYIVKPFQAELLIETIKTIICR